MSEGIFYSSGLSNVGSYQASAEPWLSSSLVAPVLGGTPLQVDFPRVTKFVVIRNDGSNTVRVGFSSHGVSGTVTHGDDVLPHPHFITLDEDKSFSADFRVSRLYLLSNTAAGTGDVTIVAGLTRIQAGHLEGNWSGSAGVG